MRVLHIVGGAMTNGAFKGAEILHKALINSKINSKDVGGEDETLRISRFEMACPPRRRPTRLVSLLTLLIENGCKSSHLTSNQAAIAPEASVSCDQE